MILERSSECYEDFADEIIVKGKDWPYDFSWDLIGKTFKVVLMQGQIGLLGWILIIFSRKHIKLCLQFQENMTIFQELYFHSFNFYP